MAAVTFSLDVLNIPELIWDVRKEMADLLREEARSEGDPRIALRLEEIANVFEAGVADVG